MAKRAVLFVFLLCSRASALVRTALPASTGSLPALTELTSFRSLPASTELTSFRLVRASALAPGLDDGAALTRAGFAPSGPEWTSATVPCTVVACLLEAGVIAPDVFFGDNIAKIDAKQFDGPWWYWTSSAALTDDAGFASLVLEGVGYRAEVWANGALLGGNTTVVGAFVEFELDLGAAALWAGATNLIAIKVWRQYDESLGPKADDTIDLGITFVDWSYAQPPDSNLGLWRKVFLKAHGAVTLRAPGVLSTLAPAPTPLLALGGPPLAFAFADLTVVVEARNADKSNAAAGTLSGSVRAADGGAVLCTFTRAVNLVAGASASLSVTSADAPCLKIASPSLWWPWQMGGAPTLHLLNLSVTLSSAPDSDALEVPFGIRTATSALDGNKNRLFKFNTLPILVRGGGWSPDLFQRVDAARLSQQLALTRDLGLNAIRLEGKLEPNEFFESLDSLGILALPGWCCCDAWQHWGKWQSEQKDVAAASMRSQALRLRRFASMLGFLISSDELPPEDVEQLYLDELALASWPAFAATVSAASSANSRITGETGVKMSGPYSWVPPGYWTEDHGQRGVGGGWGFLTEGGPGETPMTFESIAATTPAGDMWPPAPTNAWGKAGNPLGNFGSLSYFNLPLAARYGNATQRRDYLAKSAAMSIEGHRAFIEGYSVRKYVSTGLIQWMLQNDAPSNIWHLFHWDLTVGSAGAAVKGACAPPLHAAWVYNSSSVMLVNSLYAAAPHADVVASIVVFSSGDATIFARNATVAAGSVPADGLLALPALTPPPPISGGGAYFLRLSLADAASGEQLDSTTYWLAEKADQIKWSASTWYNTPVSKFADLAALFSPAVGAPRVTVSASFAAVDGAELASPGARWLAGRAGGEGQWTRATITVANAGAGIAFLVRLRIVPAGGMAPAQVDPAPLFFSDNYLVLRTGEERIVTCEFAQAVVNGTAPAVAWDFGGGGA